MNGKCVIAHGVCGIIFLLVVIQLIPLKARYEHIQDGHRLIYQQWGDVAFAFRRGAGDAGILYVGDILGINASARDKVKILADRHPEARNGQLYLFGLRPESSGPVTQDNFLNRISTSERIVLADNFCIQDWDQIRQKEIYQETNLTPGSYCFSETQTQFVDHLIRQLHVTEAWIYYDVPQYLDYIQTFLEYLKERNITIKAIATNGHES